MKRQIVSCLLAFVAMAPLVLVTRDSSGALHLPWSQHRNPSAEPEPPVAQCWVVEGAGARDYNGMYLSAGSAGGHPCYKRDAGHWLWCSADSAVPGGRLWHLSDEPGGASAYSGAVATGELPANPWAPQQVVGPAPSLRMVDPDDVWVVRGAGESAYNGVYCRAEGFNCLRSYKRDDRHWLWFLPGQEGRQAWFLGPEAGSGDWRYRGAPGCDLPASPWTSKEGAAPTVTAWRPSADSAGAFTVRGAGDKSFDGRYTPAGAHMGKACYRKDDDHWLWCQMLPAPSRTAWVLGHRVCGRPRYASAGSSIEGPWCSRAAGESAPVVAGSTTQAPETGAPGWSVSAAGDLSYNGQYAFAGLWNDYACYRKDSGHWLWHEEAGHGTWALGGRPGAEPAYTASTGSLPGNRWVTVGGRRPGPSLAAIPVPAPGALAAWLVTGAGDGDYDGLYSRAGTCGDKALYRKDDLHYLWVRRDRGGDRWALSPVPGNPDATYLGPSSRGTPAGRWSELVGTAPAPTVMTAGPVALAACAPVGTGAEALDADGPG